MGLPGSLGSLAAALVAGTAQQRIRRLAIMAEVWAIAAVLVLGAFVLGLIAAYLGLRMVPFSDLQAVLILAGALVSTALLVIAVGRLVANRRQRRRAALPAPVSLTSLAMSQALGGMKPAHLLVAAFVAGVAVELLGGRGKR